MTSLAKTVGSCLVLIGLTATGWAADANGMKSWTGKVGDEKLKKLAPRSGFISDVELWKDLWTAWRPGEALPNVDFEKDLILVGTVAGPNLIMMRPTVDTKGDLTFVVAGTRMAGPGFGYKLISVDRKGVVAVNGTPLADGQRRESHLVATTGPDTRITIRSDDGSTIVETRSSTGIGTATLRRVRTWPPGIVVRLHLNGLESFKMTSGDVAVEWSISSTAPHVVRVSQTRDGETTLLNATNPYFSTVRIVANDRSIPLKDGFFEVAVPAKLLEGDPEQITLRWIDFYRS